MNIKLDEEMIELVSGILETDESALTKCELHWLAIRRDSFNSVAYTLSLILMSYLYCVYTA